MLDPIAIDECDHRYEAKGHDPGVKLRHLSQIRHATCTGPGCRRPSTQVRFRAHRSLTKQAARSCLCNGGPKCRSDHRLKQHPEVEGRATHPRHLPLDHPVGAPIHHRTNPVPDLMTGMPMLTVPAGWAQACRVGR